jgi:hypothetical protein
VATPALRANLYRYVHSEEIRRPTDETSLEGHRLARITRDRHPDKVTIANQPVGGIERHPAGTGQIDLRPGMRNTTADQGFRAPRILAEVSIAWAWDLLTFTNR